MFPKETTKTRPPNAFKNNRLLKKAYCFILFYLSIITCVCAQLTKKHIKAAPVACDCKNAISIVLDKPIVTYGPTADTNGYGNVQEIPVKEKFSQYYFEQEHNSAWYTLTIGFDGSLVFDITPKVPTDDYDFLLFKYTDTGFCGQFMRRELTPIRSNISRNTDSSGLTGISISAINEYAIRGIGNAYSKFIPVKKGEKYILILDNVTKKGKGHTIVFRNVIDVTFSGIVKDDDNKPIKAEVTLEDKDGYIMGKGVSDSTTGKYNFHAGVVEAVKYTLNQMSDSTFFSSKAIVVMDSNKDKFQNIKTMLPKLKAGKKYPITSINFWGGDTTIIPESIPTVNALFMLMKKNKHMKIRIEGYVNAPYGDAIHFYNTLSLGRAGRVYHFLIGKGILKDRMSILGFGNQYPLFPFPKNEDEMQQNIRVEIKVISLK